MIRTTFVSLVIAASLAVPSAQQVVSPAAAQVTTIDIMSALPFTTITITGTGFEANSLVEFSNGARVVYRVPTLSVTPTTIKVAVPVYVGTFGISAGTVSVRVYTVNRDGSVALGSNTITGFRIQEPPVPAGYDGRPTLNFLKAARAFAADTLRARVAASTLGTTDVMATLDAQIASLDVLIAKVEPLITTSSSRFSLGYINGKDGNVNQDALFDSDYLITAVFAAQAGLAAPACLADEAKAALAELTAKSNPDIAKFASYFAATLTSANCRTADAINKTMMVVTGTGAVALGVIANASSVPVDIIVVPTLALVYTASALLTGEFAAGVAAGQTSQTVLEQVQTAFEGMKGPGEALVARPAGQGMTMPATVVDPAEKGIGVHSVYVVTNAFESALGAAPPYRGGAKTGTQVPLTLAISGSGKGMAASLPVGIGCGGTGCSTTFASGTEVVLQATPLTGSRFAGWGGACSGTAPCTLTMDSGKSVTARFDPAP